MVLEEQPAKLAEALRYFLQGLGFGRFLSGGGGYFAINFILFLFKSHT